MPMETATQEWVELPSGLYPFQKVSGSRMQMNGGLFTLKTALNMDVPAFNGAAKKYYIQIKEPDPPIYRMVKYSIFLSRKYNDVSFMPAFGEYTDMALRVAAGKARGDKPLEAFYRDILITGPWDATRDILEFQEKLVEGPEKGKYIARLLRFNEDGELETVDDRMVIAPEGWMRVLGSQHGYPTETSRAGCRVESIEDPLLQGRDSQGYLYLGSPPQKGEQRIVLRLPYWRDGGLLDAPLAGGRSCSDMRVAALRVR
ncbi:MAG: hypothetical protein HY518_05375 [Candidatus Aenigmarchaeota archaeon]|nr:hypothetical protein [Candidatus Aenigmarchaeota archaeon]